MYIATEFDIETCQPTGLIEYYLAPDKQQAVLACLYTKQLHNGKAHIGPSKLVVYDGAVGYAITTEKEVQTALV